MFWALTISTFYIHKILHMVKHRNGYKFKRLVVLITSLNGTVVFACIFGCTLAFELI